LNAIALIGNLKDNLQAVVDVLHKDQNDKDVVGAGVAAVVSLTRPKQPDDLALRLKAIGIPMDGAALLAAVQQSDVFLNDLSKCGVDPSNADEFDLRLAMIVVGLGKAPEHLFNSRHLNGDVLGSLNLHDDHSIAQYSVWALRENPRYGLPQLKIPLHDTNAQPSNVRSWIYQLVTADAPTADENRDYVFGAANDNEARARLGLAVGIRQLYLNGLDDVAMRWLENEADPEIKRALLEHMAAHAEVGNGYRDAVVESFRREPVGSMERWRLRAASQGTKLFGELYNLDRQSESLSLFGEEVMGGSSVVNISGQNVNIGIVAGRNANVSGKTIATVTINDALAELDKLKAGVAHSELPDGLVVELTAAIAAAKAEPKKSTIQKVLAVLKGAGDLLKVAKDGFDFYEAIDHLGNVADLM